MKTLISIGERIKYVREKAEMTQKAFGNRVGLSQTAVTALENNQNEPRLSTFNNIVAAFHVSPEWLRTGDGLTPERISATAYANQSPEDSKAAVGNWPIPELLTSSAATIEHADKILLREIIDGQKEQISDLRSMVTLLKEELGKSGGSPEAAKPLYPNSPLVGREMVAAA